MAADEPSQIPAQQGCDWPRVKTLFLEAIEIEEDRRGAWLDRACAGDATLRTELDSLLASDRDAGSFGETPAAVMCGPALLAAFARRLAPGSRLGHYAIEGLIGAGGMGEVYRARDTRDGREVAIKTVRAALAHPAGELRLLHEARHAATLAHPNICAIHEVGEADGTPFIAMELVEGRTLGELQGARPLPPARALPYAIDIAGALDHAHAHGVMHRDLKRSNVVIGPGDRAVVLDFGLAKRLPPAGAASADSLTASAHGPAGTLSHMAPEVLLGRRADARADVWALGVLLFELLAGELPFRGRTPFETSSAILGDPPKPLPGGVPLTLRLVIGRCLEKDPARRYQRAADVRAALMAVRDGRAWPVTARLLTTSRSAQRRLAWVAAVVLAAAVTSVFALRPSPAPIAAVAIMPLAHGGTADDRTYAQGMAEAIAAQLGASTNVRVLSTASLPADGRPAPAAGRALGANAIVTGTLRRRGEGLELDLRLVDTGTGAALWSQSFARGSRDVLVLQAEAVRALAGRIDAALTPQARERLTLVPSVRPDVYEAYLKGRYEWNQRTAGSLQRAVAHFERAIALDPTYAPAYARLADCFNLMGTVMVGSGSPQAYRPRAERAAIRALQIDPDLAEAHAALGYVQHYSWKWAEAEQSFVRAIELNPSAPLPRLWHANLLMSKGRFDEALRQVRVAGELDPFSLVINTNIGWVEYYSGRTEASIATLRRAVALDPAYPQAHWRLATSLAAAGHADEALAETEQVLRLTQRSPSSVALLALVNAIAGRESEARRAIAEFVERSRTEYASPGTIPGAYAHLGDHDVALAWMERAYHEQANAVAYFAVEPWTHTLRSDPRYQALLRRVGLADVPSP
ncbi:MAG TPA: protein kinase [Vicinamibacterales bacterium]|nr:protein kinase [Vicinamibacterales bacterium]